jgi:uncharacterized protein (DUF2236 family)
MRADPPPAQSIAPRRSSDARAFDRWVAARFSAEEVQTLFRLEREYGEQALAEWFAEVAVEAGLVGRTAH